MELINKEERRKRIKALQRQQDRNRRLPELLSGISIIIRKEITEKHVLTIEEVDTHEIELNSSDFDFNYLNISFPQEKVGELQEKVGVLSNELDQTNYLSLHQWMDIAVLKVNTSFVVDNIEQLIEFDKDSFYIHDTNYKNGLWIDLYTEYWFLDGKAELTPILELRVFGKEWMKKVAGTL